LIDESKSSSVPERKELDKPLLVGKAIRHRFSDGKQYDGEVLSVVPGFPVWYNVKYKDDPAIYVYKLQEDYAAGELEILPLPGSTEGLRQFFKEPIVFVVQFLLLFVQ